MATWCSTDPARMPAEPLADFAMFVSVSVVEDGVDDLAGRDLALDGVEEADELLWGLPPAWPL